MASTPVEFRYHSGRAALLDFDLVPADDSAKTSFDGALAEITELTNGKGRYRVTFTGGAGHYTGHIYDSDTLIDVIDYNLNDTTAVQYPAASGQAASEGFDMHVEDVLITVE